MLEGQLREIDVGRRDSGAAIPAGVTALGMSDTSTRGFRCGTTTTLRRLGSFSAMARTRSSESCRSPL